MSSSAELRAKRDKYNNCLSNVKTTLHYLNNSIVKLESLVNVQASCYSVDDVKGGSNYLGHLLERERNMYNIIKGDIIPSLSSYVRNLGDLIQEAETQEALEREM